MASRIKQQSRIKELSKRMGTPKERGILNEYCVGAIILPDSQRFSTTLYIMRYPGEYRPRGIPVPLSQEEKRYITEKRTYPPSYFSNPMSARMNTKLKELIEEYNLISSKPCRKVLHADIIADDIIIAMNRTGILNLEDRLKKHAPQRERALLYGQSDKLLRTFNVGSYFPPFNRGGSITRDKATFFHVRLSNSGSSIGIAKGAFEGLWNKISKISRVELLKAYGKNLKQLSC